MDMSPFVDRLGREFAALAEIDGEDAGALVVRLESAIRLTLSDALVAAAEEINRDLAPGSVELRFRGSEPKFVVTPPSPERSSETATDSGTPNAEEGATARINVRVSKQLKASIEQAASHEGRSVEAWLEQMASAVMRQNRTPCTADRRGKRSRQRYTAWVR